jgi:hypothetical protein
MRLGRQAPLVDHDFSAQRIAWGARLTGSPRELLNAERQSAEAEVAKFLRETLATGLMPQRDIKDAAEAHGHSWRTIRRAQQVLNIKPTKDGKGPWCWTLPPDD